MITASLTALVGSLTTLPWTVLMLMFQLVVLPTILADHHGYGPKCRTVYKTEYKGGVLLFLVIF